MKGAGVLKLQSKINYSASLHRITPPRHSNLSSMQPNCPSLIVSNSKSSQCQILYTLNYSFFISFPGISNLIKRLNSLPMEPGYRNRSLRDDTFQHEYSSEPPYMENNTNLRLNLVHKILECRTYDEKEIEYKP